MANKPVVLLIRFLLELFGLFAFGLFGWQSASGFMRYLLAAALPVMAAVIWGTFRVPNDPGPAPVSVPGWLRLTIEILFFSCAAVFLFLAGSRILGSILAATFVVLYAISYDRVVWLLTQKH